MKRRFFWLALISFLLVGACAKKETKFKELPTGPINHHLIAIAKDKSGVRARGFSGACPKSAKIFFEVGTVNTNATCSGDGSFNIFLDNTDVMAEVGELTFTVDANFYQHAYEIKDLRARLAQVAKAPFDINREIDDITIDDNKLWSIASSAAMLNVATFDERWLLTPDQGSAVLLGDANAQPKGPRKLSKAGSRLLVSLHDSHELALVDSVNHKAITRSRLNDQTGKLYTYDITPPLRVKEAIDALGDGNKTSTIDKSAARNSEDVIAIDETTYLVTFTNYFQAMGNNGEKAVVGPGVIALISIEGDTITTQQILKVDFKNPNEIIKESDDTYWVLCSGAWSENSDGSISTSDAGLIKLSIAADKNSFARSHSIDLKDFAAARPEIIGDQIVIPKYWTKEVVVVPKTATEIDKTKIKSAEFNRDLFFTFASHWHDDIVFLGDAHGSLTAFSVNDGFFPFPFVEPIATEQTRNPQASGGVQSIYFRHKIVPYDLAASFKEGFSGIVQTFSYKIIPLDFLAIFGP